MIEGSPLTGSGSNRLFELDQPESAPPPIVHVPRERQRVGDPLLTGGVEPQLPAADVADVQAYPIARDFGGTRPRRGRSAVAGGLRLVHLFNRSCKARSPQERGLERSMGRRPRRREVFSPEGLSGQCGLASGSVRRFPHLQSAVALRI